MPAAAAGVWRPPVLGGQTRTCSASSPPPGGCPLLPRVLQAAATPSSGSLAAQGQPPPPAAFRAPRRLLRSLSLPSFPDCRPPPPPRLFAPFLSDLLPKHGPFSRCQASQPCGHDVLVPLFLCPPTRECRKAGLGEHEQFCPCPPAPSRRLRVLGAKLSRRECRFLALQEVVKGGRVVESHGASAALQ